jgi:hypothetical protein
MAAFKKGRELTLMRVNGLHHITARAGLSSMQAPSAAAKARRHRPTGFSV